MFLAHQVRGKGPLYLTTTHRGRSELVYDIEWLILMLYTFHELNELHPFIVSNVASGVVGEAIFVEYPIDMLH